MTRATRRTRPRLALSVQRAVSAGERGGAPRRPQILRWARAALEPGGVDVAVTLRLVDEAEGRALNRAHRGKDYATNVLTFVYGEETTADGTVLSGDIAICAPVVIREAAAQGKAPEAHYAHLVVHGMLHLQGHDHETSEADARRMEEKERAILDSLGFADPYDLPRD